MRKLFLLISILLFTWNANASLVYNSNCIKAYRKIISLRIAEGKQLIELERKSNPSNSIPLFLENYIDFMTLLTRENRSEFEELKIARASRVKKLEAEDKKSPFYLYSLAEINLQWAINRFKFQDYVTGAYELQKAYRQLEENQRRFPAFLPNQKGLGVLYALFGSIPEQYKWVLSGLGLEGSVQKGINMLEELKNKLPASAYYYLEDETVFYLTFIQLSIENDRSVYEKMLVNTGKIDKDNLLTTFLKTVVALKTGHNDEAISFLLNRPKGPAYIPFPHLDYLTGLAKLNRFDDDAPIYFHKYLKNYSGSYNVKDAYLKLSWFYLIKGQLDLYYTYKDLCIKKGDAISEKDKESMRTAQSADVPDLYLLKARLYFDGGYYAEALQLLKNKKIEDFNSEKERLEFTYRLGRIYYEIDKYDLAIQHFTSILSRGIDKPYYFAANSALQLGFIFEARKNYPKAVYYYELSMKINTPEYKNSIESKAKAGLSRVKKA